LFCGGTAACARTSIALDRIVEIHDLGRLPITTGASGAPRKRTRIGSVILGTSLLTSRGIPGAREYEIKNAQAMKIMDSFGAGGPFTEHHAVDYYGCVVAMGHDGPSHIAIGEGKTQFARSMSITAKPDVDSRWKLELLVAEGESVARPILGIGNTNSDTAFPLAPGAFSTNGTCMDRLIAVPWESVTSQANRKS
jgi:L-arabinose isomerase